MKNFQEALNSRFACKLYDEHKKISDDDFDSILEAGRLAPSSFGLEHTHFLVIQNKKLKEIMSPAVFKQPQVTTCSHFVVLLSKKPEFFTKDSKYLDEAFRRITKEDEKKLQTIKDNFLNFSENVLKPDLTNWSKMQSYLAGANMMNMAAALDINSCPIEGFSYDELLKLLVENISCFDIKSYNISFCISFGYGLSQKSEKIRWPLDKLVTFIK